MTESKRIDWADLLDRTRLAEKAALKAGSVSPQDRERILRSRAGLLAAPVRIQHETDAAHSVAILRCGSDRYAMQLSDLVEVIQQPKIAVVPHAPAFVAGLIQVRGEIRPVYNLYALLGHGPATADMPALVVLVTAGSAEFGIGVDAVEDIRQVAPESRTSTQVTPGHAGWITDDLIPCLAANTLIPEPK